METCIIGFQNRHLYPNFKALPMSFQALTRDGSVRFVSHENPQVECVDYLQVGNFDLLISDNRFALEPPDFLIQRYSKVEQSIRLEEIRRKLTPANFRCIRSFNKNEQTPYDGHQLLPYKNISRYLVAKPINGARSMATVVIDTEQINPVLFLRKLGQCETAEAVEQYIASLDGSVAFSRGISTDPNEYITLLREQSFQLSEYVFGIQLECRVILDKSCRPTLTEIRHRGSHVIGKPLLDVEFLQPTEESGNVSNQFLLPLPYQKYDEEIREVLKELPPLSSVDLFFTDKDWGIFEFSPEWSTLDFEIGQIKDLLIDLIVDLYEKKHQ